MYREYTIYWIVDNSTGNTQIFANSKEDVLQYFNFNFKRFGYALIRIE